MLGTFVQFCSYTCMTLAVLQAVAQQVLDLRALLPHVDVSRMLAQHPNLIFKLEPGRVSQQLHLLGQASAHFIAVKVNMSMVNCLII